MILNENEAKNLLTKVLSYSKADSASASLEGNNTYNIRFARNSISTNGFSDGLSVRISSSIGKKTGSVSTNKFDEASLKNAVKMSEDIARVSPDNKEFMPPLGSQTYLNAVNFSENTESLKGEDRSQKISYIIDKSVSSDVTSAGYMEDEVTFIAIQNTSGLFAYNKASMAKLSSTVRTNDGTGSGRFERNYVDVNKIDGNSVADWAIGRSKLSVNPGEIKPGRYTVILEHAAAADMLNLCIDFMGSREADEGRSYFSKKGGGTLIGEKIADDKVNIYSDPADVNAPSVPFTGSGEPMNRVVWFENGVLKNLHRNRYWAEKTSQPAMPYPSNIIMQGGTKSVDELIAESEDAVLVTRFWYIRTVDPKTMLLTGLTRDGVFEIKNGKITRPVKNFRFNESPMNILKNIITLGSSEKAVGAETDDYPIYVPAMKVANFNFSSLSDAI
ncbi:MAG: TldD/PmbA family protein [Ignavibacteria bacterium]